MQFWSGQDLYWPNLLPTWCAPPSPQFTQHLLDMLNYMMWWPRGIEHTHGFYRANKWRLSTPSPLVSDLCLRLLGTLERHNKAIRCGLWNGYDALLICVIQVNSILYRQLWGPLASICILMTMLRLLRFHTTLDTRIMNGKRNGAVSGFYLLFCIVVSRPFLK